MDNFTIYGVKTDFFSHVFFNDEYKFGEDVKKHGTNVFNHFFAVDRMLIPIFIPISTAGGHWIKVVIEFIVSEIWYFDSLHKDMDKYTDVVFRLLEDAANYISSGENERVTKRPIDFKKHSWKARNCGRYISNQGSTMDCGIYIMACIDFLFVFKKIDESNNISNVVRTNEPDAFFRRKFASELIKCKLPFPHKSEISSTSQSLGTSILRKINSFHNFKSKFVT